MPEMRLSRLLASVPSLEVLERGGQGDPIVRGICFDSRLVQAGDLFVALPGLHTDGHGFIEAAVGAGAVAVLHSKPVEPARREVTHLRVADTRRAMSALAAALCGHPSRLLRVIGVTGTDGKSTTVALIHQLLSALGEASGFLSTASYLAGCAAEPNPWRQSTPEAPQIQELLRRMAEAGKRYAVLEATSHGLSERTGRLLDVRFAAAVLTNVTHEHLEFHGTFESYRSDKANLFRSLDLPAAAGEEGGDREPRFGVLNADDPSASYIRAQTASPLFTYSLESPAADLYAGELDGSLAGSTVTLRLEGRSARVRLALPGAFNVQNLMAAVLTVSRLLGVGLEQLAPHVAGLRGVKGRMELIEEGQPFRVIVDYAHTPESFARLFPLVRRHTPGGLIAVFGSAGERDVEKRARQGEVAARFCRLAVLADEDPRGEEREEILRQIASGVPPDSPCRTVLQPDRRLAIQTAFAAARPGDTVLLLGKGHEQSIIMADGSLPWDETNAARQALAGMGYRR